ncbi:GGDEF domain-containing protein [Deinococcus malanensis]|uniref:GGDEF domain-containing protein n=1 Tax=Deinococcus malanensis TaxID=1706855 RepID=UPI00166DD2F5|nr:sensor domain-containing diguanylate cyclase [Deinococcus malanensis]
MSALLDPASARPYFLITQPLLIAFSFVACALLWARRVSVPRLEQSAMLLLTSVVLGRSLLEIFTTQPPPVVLDSQALIGLLLCAVSGFLVLRRRAALTFVGTLFLLQAGALGVTLWSAPVPLTSGRLVAFASSQLSLATLFILRDALFWFRLGHTQLLDDQERLTRLADKDPLTGLLNRRSLEQTCDQLQRSQQGYLLAVVDADDFKTINDVFGHLEGDRVLIGMAQGLRQARYAARWGGEEFLVLFPALEPHEALERLQSVITDTQGLLDTLGPLAVTMSVGAVWVEPGAPWQPALKQADQAMYAAKQRGKNQLVVGGNACPCSGMGALEGSSEEHA